MSFDQYNNKLFKRVGFRSRNASASPSPNPIYMQTIPILSRAITERVVIFGKSSQIWIVIMIFRMIWHQMDLRLVSDQTNECNYNPHLVWFNIFRNRVISVCHEAEPKGFCYLRQTFISGMFPIWIHANNIDADKVNGMSNIDTKKIKLTEFPI